MKLGDVVRENIVGITKDGICRVLPLSVIRKPSGNNIKTRHKHSIVIASHYKWLESRQHIPKNCIKVFHSFYKNIEWCNYDQVSLSESDMVDRSWCGGFKASRKPEGVLMVTLDHESGMSTKGFFLTALVAEACKKTNNKLTIIDYGRGGGVSKELNKVRDFLNKNNYNIIRRKPDNNQKQLAEIFRKHKLFFCTSVKDASPKTVPEALCRGLRVVMNKACWGGTKYIDGMTGRLVELPDSSDEMWDTFDDSVEKVMMIIEEEINKCNNPFAISNYYHSKWGLYNSSIVLASELKSYFPGYDAICYEELRKNVIKEVVCRKES